MLAPEAQDRVLNKLNLLLNQAETIYFESLSSPHSETITSTPMWTTWTLERFSQ